MLAVDWNTVKPEKIPESGGKFDYSIYSQLVKEEREEIKIKYFLLLVAVLS